MAGENGLHLGNCDSFVASWKTPRSYRRGPKPVAGHGSVLVGHILVVFGWSGLGMHDGQVYICNVRTFRWKLLQTGGPGLIYAPMLMGFVHNDTIFAIPHLQYDDTSVYVLDLVYLDAWERVQLKTNVGRVAGAFHEEREEAILCKGKDLYIFSPESRVLRSVRASGMNPGSRSYHSCCTSPSTFFLVGGYDNTDNFLDFAPFRLYALLLRSMTWTVVVPNSGFVPPGRSNFSMSYMNGRIFVLGGVGGYSRIDVFGLQSCCWQTVVATPKGKDELKLRGESMVSRHAHVTICTRDKLMIIGGKGWLYNVLTIAPSPTDSSINKRMGEVES